MGLLAALAFHAKAESEEPGYYSDVEYRLHSWGEIYPPYLGDREHSTSARFILADFPFKLFSSSRPYDDPLPQKLTLTFKAPYETRAQSEHVRSDGVYPHEIAREFAAFLSVVTRRRVFAVRQVRSDGLPIEEEADFYLRSHCQEQQRLKEIDPAHIYSRLESLRRLPTLFADAFVIALRLYHAAVEMLYSDPEFSYLFLVMSLEAISSVVCEGYQPANIGLFLDSRFPCWREIEGLLPSERRGAFVDLLVRNEAYTFCKVLKFVEEFLPGSFWAATEDDAKPHYLEGIVGAGADGLRDLTIKHANADLHDFERIDQGRLQHVLRAVYSARSELLHRGKRFPASIALGHFRYVPSGAFDEMMERKVSQSGDLRPAIPPLLTFERLVSQSLVNYLSKSASG